MKLSVRAAWMFAHFLFLATTLVESFQNADSFQTLHHRRRRVWNASIEMKQQQQQQQHPLKYKSYTLVGDNEMHSFWFPEQQENESIVPSSSSTLPSPSVSSPINNKHSSADWLHNLKTIPSSTVLRESKGPVLSLAGWATFVSIVYNILKSMGKHSAASSLTISSSSHGFVVSSLGLLLVFRTNSAYQRFLEGRTIWENIHSISRNLSRMVYLYRPQLGVARTRRVMNLLAAFPYLLRHHVRSGCLCSKQDPVSIDPKYRILLHNSFTNVVDSRYEGDKASGGVTHVSSNDDISTASSCFVDTRNLPWSLLKDNSDTDLRGVAQAINKPLWILDRLGQEIMGIPYNAHFCSRERAAFLCFVEKLTATIGQCERIHQTSVPLNYARHSLRALSVFLMTLPFCLVKDMGLLTGPVTAIMAWLLFGIYQIGYHVEDPFQGSLRLSILCDAIRKDLLSSDESAFHSVDDRENDENKIVTDSTWIPTPTIFLPNRPNPLQLVDLTTSMSSSTPPAASLHGLKP
ncbi:bestrophin, RFP-TM, chloride channel [Nitzschia inconspicua]|uniref:Bestrophin, RFP-TM, chloride channel n=1 Tax=Nitzschia inconspicua TaxID=303405 RepID=A0A9K3M0G7_9STRA|nr:bestrophin, RFP-TM, chloride channel [Nitzschia inconspicua]KAG7371612.1 bestrophin, RFP-TM, chloride channel [Nitzschia inconspicua]